MSSAFVPIVRTRPCPIFGRPVHQGSLPFDYSPILLLKPFGFRIAPDTLSSGIRRATGSRSVLAVSGFRLRARLDFSIPSCSPGQRGITPASLIGHSGSSTFRLSTTAVSMSLAGSCFSPESAPGPFHHGIRRRGGTIFWSALPSNERQVQADIRSHLIRRPARDIIPPPGGARVSSYRV